MKKICVTGGNGLLGIKLLSEASGRYLTVSVDVHDRPIAEFNNMKYIRGDITDSERILNIIKDEKPDCLMHTAAFTQVDLCETEKEKAWKVNVDGARNTALACQSQGIKMIHVSSDYVFDGTNGPYDEDAEPNPISYYGQTKWESEKEVFKILDDVIIVRTTVLYGFFPGIRPNFVTWAVDQLKNHKPVAIVGDQQGTPTFADDLASAMLVLFEKNKKGLYNTVGSELISRYDFVQKISEVFALDNNLIHETTSDKLQQPAPRPLKGGLKIDKIYNETGFEFSPVRKGLEIMKQQMKEYEQSGAD